MGDPHAVDAAIIKGAETIDLREGGSHGVLLLHGFGDTPQTLSLFARHLVKRGFAVYAPLLPGHGRTMKEFMRSRADDWVRAAMNALTDMRRRYATVSVSGLSMGGALAVIIAADRTDIKSLVLFAPYLGMPRWLRGAALTFWAWGRMVGPVRAESPLSIHDPIEREKNLAYGEVTGRMIFELARVVRRADDALPEVSAAALINHSTEEPRGAPAVAEKHLKKHASPDKKTMLTSWPRHAISPHH